MLLRYVGRRSRSLKLMVSDMVLLLLRLLKNGTWSEAECTRDVGLRLLQLMLTGRHRVW